MVFCINVQGLGLRWKQGSFCSDLRLLSVDVISVSETMIVDKPGFDDFEVFAFFTQPDMGNWVLSFRNSLYLNIRPAMIHGENIFVVLNVNDKESTGSRQLYFFRYLKVFLVTSHSLVIVWSRIPS